MLRGEAAVGAALGVVRRKPSPSDERARLGPAYTHLYFGALDKYVTRENRMADLTANASIAIAFDFRGFCLESTTTITFVWHDRRHVSLAFPRTLPRGFLHTPTRRGMCST